MQEVSYQLQITASYQCEAKPNASYQLQITISYSETNMKLYDLVKLLLIGITKLDN